MYAEAKELYERVTESLSWKKKQLTCSRREEITFGGPGNVFISLGEYIKVKKYHEKAPTISIEIRSC